jgi:hypothetical protein
MRLVVFLTTLLAGAIAHAQVPPEEPTAHRLESRLVRPEMVGSPTDDYRVLRDLIAAQTQAIKALAAKVGTIENRVQQLEGRRP